MRDDIIQIKLTPPSLPSGMVARPRLHARLEDAAARVVLVAAPAGFGKTALVLEWLARSTQPMAWLSVDRADNDPTRFFNHLAASIGGLPLAAAEHAAGLVRTLAHRSGPAADVQEAFGALGAGTVIVLDDVHELSERRVLAGLEQLLALRGTGPRMVLLSRIDPPLSLSRLRVSGALAELRERDLRFTHEECLAFFRALLPAALDAGLVSQLESRTEGWAAGLRLAAIALRDVPDANAAVAAFHGSHRVVVDYLVEEALEKQSPAVQQFLLDTSLLDRFTPDTCAAVTQDVDARARLAEIEAANLFLVPLGSGGRWYRYHHLFRELLEFRLHRLQPGRAELLHERAAAWFEAEGDVHSAIEHACRMSDRTPLLHLLDRHGLDIIIRSELASFERWLEHLPDPLAQPYPMLIVGTGWLRLLTQRAPDLHQVLEAAESALARAPADYDPHRKWLARIQTDVLRAFAARFDGRLEEAIEMTRAVLADVPEEEPFTRGLVNYNLARLQMLMGEMRVAAKLFEDSFQDNLRANSIYVVLTGLGQTAAVRAQLEGVYRAREELQAAAAFAEQRRLTMLPAYSAVLYHLANVEYLADRLDEAEAAAERAVELGRPGNFPEGHANGLLSLARVAIARGDVERADAVLTEVAALARDRNVVLADSTVELEQVRLALAREQRGQGPPVAPLDPGPESGRWTTMRELHVMLCLRQALRTGRYEIAAGLAERLAHASERRERGVACCVAQLAQALLPERTDRWQKLEEALQLAATRGYVRPLLDFGELLRPLLQAGLARGLTGSARALARQLLERIDGDVRPATSPAAGLLEPLTAREAEALAHLCAGMSNKAMARAMFVSPETVKTHLQHLYWKLGATRREQAIARAQELGLVRALDA